MTGHLKIESFSILGLLVAQRIDCLHVCAAGLRLKLNVDK